MDNLGLDGMNQPKSNKLGLVLGALGVAFILYVVLLIGANLGFTQGALAGCNAIAPTIGRVVRAPEGAVSCIRQDGRLLFKFEGTNSGTIKTELDGLTLVK